MKNYTIRLEQPEDYRTVETLIREAFWNVYRPGCSEHYVIHCFRDKPDFVKDLDFVLEVDGKIIGQVMFVQTDIIRDDGKKIPIAVFGPIGILPEYQKQGWGKILLNYALEKAKEKGFGAICIEGNIEFYKHCGFSLAWNFNVHYSGLPKEDHAGFFLCRELVSGYLEKHLEGQHATFSDPQGYFVDEKAVEEFDKNFSPKEKLKLPGQLV